MRSALIIGALALLALGPACVSRSAGRAEAEALIAERSGLGGGRPDDDATAKARADLLAKPLTADSCARLALLDHPDVAAAFADLGVARSELVDAVALPNPRVDASMRFFDRGNEYDVGATIDVTRLLSLASREGAASDALDAASIEAAGVALDVALEAKRAFYAYAAAQQVLELRRTVAFAFAQSADLSERLYEAGNVPALDPAQERAMFEDSRLMVARAEADTLAARERLAAATGLFGAEAARLTVPARLEGATEPAPDVRDLERVALEKSLDLRALRSRYAAAAGRSDVAGWGFLPELSAGAVAERSDGEWGVGPQIGVEIPIFDHGQGESAAAEAQMSGAKARMRATAIRIRASARTLATRLVTTRDQARFYEMTLLPLRQRVVDETELQYNAMNASAFQLLAAKRDQIDAARAYVETLRDYWTLRAEVEQLARGRLTTATVTAMPTEPASRGGAGH